MLVYCQLESCEQVSVKIEFEFYHFHSSRCIWKCRLPTWRPYCPGGWGGCRCELNWRLTKKKILKNDVNKAAQWTKLGVELSSFFPSMSLVILTRSILSQQPIWRDFKKSLYHKRLTHREIMMTSSNENFSALLALCAKNSLVIGEFSQRPVTWSFDVFFDIRRNKWSCKQSRHQWFETPSRSLWLILSVVNMKGFIYVIVVKQTTLMVYVWF